MRRKIWDSESGVSVMELLIVLVITMIVATMAVALFGRSTENFERQNAARQFKNFLERARFDSVKRNATDQDQMATVRVLSATSFSYTIDQNQNGRLDSGETTTIDLSLLGDVRISGNNLVFPITTRFDYRGQTITVNGAAAAVSPIFYFCNGPCTPSTATAANANIVYVSPTGTVAMMRGGESIPTFNNPEVTSIDSTTSVNPLLVEWVVDPNVTTPTPTPTPTATPTSTPTGSPTPSPTATPTTPWPTSTPTLTPTPTQSPTPTPSPTPPSCSAGQDVATGCRCVSPMWVRSNGKCR